jgi:hypothetical protein
LRSTTAPSASAIYKERKQERCDNRSCFKTSVVETGNIGPVIPQCRVRFLSQLAPQPIATARQIVAAEYEWWGYQ